MVVVVGAGRQPWQGMSAIQVIGAVGFAGRRLQVPEGLEPGAAELINQCCHGDPAARPGFPQILEALQNLLAGHSQSRSDATHAAIR